MDTDEPTTTSPSNGVEGNGHASDADVTVVINGNGAGGHDDPDDASTDITYLLKSNTMSDSAYADGKPKGLNGNGTYASFEVSSGKRESTNSMRNLVISAVLGNILEWYDFGVFASFSKELSRAFFTGGKLEEMLQVYGVFAVAFFARPVGGFMSGLIGDTYGRTLSLQISVVAMGASALVISVLPTNSLGSYSIGPAATLMLVGARVVQGLSTGGEMVGSMLYMVENVHPNYKVLVSSIPMASAIAGTGCGYLVAAVVTVCTNEEQRSLWGWRLAFAIGVPAGLVGFMFRQFLSESHSFLEASEAFRKARGGHPFFYACRHCGWPLLVVMVLCVFVCGFYSCTVWYLEAWLEEFYTDLLGEDRNLSKFMGRSLNTVMVIFGLAGCTVLCAYIIDTKPKIPLHYYLAGSSFVLIAMFPVTLFMMAQGTQCYPCVVLGQLGAMLLFTPAVATLPMWLVSNFPPVVQYTSIALCYNIAQATLGGTLPYIATYISSREKNDLNIAPSFYMSAIALMGFASVVLTRLSKVRTFVDRMHGCMDFGGGTSCAPASSS